MRSRIGGSDRRVIALAGRARTVELPAPLIFSNAAALEEEDSPETMDGDNDGGPVDALDPHDMPWKRPQREQQEELAELVSAGPRKRRERAG